MVKVHISRGIHRTALRQLVRPLVLCQYSFRHIAVSMQLPPFVEVVLLRALCRLNRPRVGRDVALEVWQVPQRLDFLLGPQALVVICLVEHAILHPLVGGGSRRLRWRGLLGRLDGNDVVDIGLHLGARALTASLRVQVVLVLMRHGRLHLDLA